jgi:hypothetical protein
MADFACFSALRGILPAVIISLATSATAARADELQLAENAPDRYVVVKGDTLWDISGKFLKDPWRWPEIWAMNKADIKDPHWIYPGDVIILDRSGATPRLRLLGNATNDALRNTQKLSPKVRVTQLEAQAAPTIPAHSIEPFLSKPLVVDIAQFNSAPRLALGPDNRLIMTTGDIAYVTGLTGTLGDVWQVFKPGKPLYDPDTREPLGYEVSYAGDVVLEAIHGNVATVRIASVAQEVSVGDRLVPKLRREFPNYVPRVPASDVQGKIIASYGGVGAIGPYSTVVINRGSNDGLELGHVLRALKAPRLLTKGERKEADTYTPAERNGYVFIYRVFPRVAYGLTLNNPLPLNPLDMVVKP